MVIKRTFNGKMNFDDAKSVLPQGDYTSALNITMDADAVNQDNLINNIAGNQKVDFTLPSGINKVISGEAGVDNTKNRAIYFIYNSNGYHTIAEFNKTTRTITKIFQSRTDSADVDILNLQLSYKVNSINVIHREEEGDLLLWNDAYNRPGQLNIDDFKNGIYTNLVSDDLIRLARIPPVDDFLPAYQSDPAILVNNLKRKLFQFACAWGYKNGEISTISPTTKVVVPYDAYSVETESDPGKNNIISLPLVAGGEDYKFIRIFGRESTGTTWGDWFVIDTIDKDDYGIPPGGTFTYKFQNDGQYIAADQNYMNLLFDYCADKCNDQTLVNGNVIVQGGITDGYNPINRSDINVQITSDYKITERSTTTPAKPTITVNSYNSVTPPLFTKRTDFIIGSSISAGCEYKIKFDVPVYEGDDYNGVNATAISTGNDAAAISAVAQQLVNDLNPQVHPVTPFRNVTYVAPNIVRVNNGTYFIGNIITSATAPVFFNGGSATWKWAAKYRFGLVYVDKYGKTNGVISFVGTETDPTDFSLTTPTFAFDDDFASDTYGNPKIPIIRASINHIPPDWAVAYYWVRTPNQTVSSFLEYITCDTQTDANYIYLCIQNLQAFKDDNTGFIPFYSFKSGDRLRPYARISESTGQYTVLDTPAYDFEILGTVERDMTITSGTPTKGTFLKVKKPNSPAGILASKTIFIEIYTPAVRDTNTTQVFYEFGEAYPIYIDSITGIHYHVGQQQNQTATQAATYTFEDGDVYFKFRDFYKLNVSTGKIDPTTVYLKGVMDANYSDYWSSTVNSNGTALVIDPSAKRLFQPTIVRNGQAYQPGTNINGLNRFYAVDFDEYDRSFGAIMRLLVRDRILRVYQKLKVGAVPVLTQIIKDAAGNDVLAVSDKLLNPVQYYKGDYGIGDNPESLASNNYADYFTSNIRGVICRISQDGLTPISILYKANTFGINEVAARGFNYKMYGAFDEFHNKYILALEATADRPAQTISFNEMKNGFDSFLSYQPEAIICLNQLVISFKDGELWTHDSTTPNNFYGVQYTSKIKGVFNDGPDQKKTFTALSLVSKNQWIAPLITTSLGQVSNLSQATDFRQKEGVWYGALLRDANSPKGINAGDTLKGRWMEVELETVDGSVANDLFVAETKFITSNLNNR